MYNKTKLPNGLTVASYEMPSRVSAALGIWVRVGSRYESKPLNGVSHFLEHLLFKGTAKRNCEQIKQAIEGIGGSLNGFTSEELTCYLAKVPSRHLGSALEVLADMVLNARLDTKDIELERKVILEEIRMYKDLPGHYVLDLLAGLLWPSQPLGRNIAGECDTISKISAAQLHDYKQRFYQSGNIFVVSCGNLKQAQVLAQCNKHFAQKDKRNPESFLAVRQKQAQARLKIHTKNTEQTHLALGLYGLARGDRDRFALGLLHIILGANMSSRLFREVREVRGLAYSIGTSLKLLQDTGAFIVHAGIDNKRVLEALEVILAELRKIKKENIEKEELDRAKEYYMGQVMLALEDTSEHMLWLGENLISLNKFLYLQEVIRQVKKIQACDLTRLANQILQNRSLNLAIIGPLKENMESKIKQRLAL
ncbi:M16 family metallopeptidase [Candidatus Omnitrophota bacterium]